MNQQYFLTAFKSQMLNMKLHDILGEIRYQSKIPEDTE